METKRRHRQSTGQKLKHNEVRKYVCDYFTLLFHPIQSNSFYISILTVCQNAHKYLIQPFQRIANVAKFNSQDIFQSQEQTVED